MSDKKIKMMPPINAITWENIQNLESDNFPRTPKVWSMYLMKNKVAFINPKGNTEVLMPKKQFDNILRWYLKPQKTYSNEGE